jgi:hypothetical protein
MTSTILKRFFSAGLCGSRLTAAGLGLVTLTSVLTACGSDDPASTGPTGADYTLASVRGTWEERRTLFLAQEQLILKCMKAKGKIYFANELPAKSSTWDTFGQFTTVGPGDDVEKARRQGYGSADLLRQEKSSPKSRNGDYSKSLPPAQKAQWEKALIGDGKTISYSVPGRGDGGSPANGCFADANRELYKDLTKWYQAEATITSIGGLISSKFAADEEFPGIVTKWASCMGANGYDFKSPTEAGSAAVGAVRAASKSKNGYAAAKGREIKIAVAAAECDKQVGYSATGKRIWSKHQAQILTEREADVLAYRELRLAALTRAKEVLKNA